MRKRGWLGAAGLALGCMLAASAPGAGDAEAGRVKAQTCTGCHSIATYYNVYPTYRVPKLGGQHAEYIVAALKAYKSGERAHHSMHANAINLSDQDMADIGAFFANEVPGGQAAAKAE
ncbi:MAG: c-type cytochrome [Chromatiales bacterium]